MTIKKTLPTAVSGELADSSSELNLAHAENEVRIPQTKPLFILEPSHRWRSLQLGTLWSYRELLFFLVWRDIKVRYKQSVVGVAWVILQPVIMMFVFTLLFSNFGQLPSDGLPYPIFTFAALLPWQLFANSLSMAGTSLVMNQHIITKVYFPRLLVPLAAVLVGLVDFAISLIVLLGLMIFYGVAPTVALFALPIFISLAILTAFAMGLWLSALNVQYRDVQYAIPFMVQVWLFVTPVAYATSIVPEKWRFFYSLNPMVGVIDGFRWALLSHQAGPIDSNIFISVSIVGVLLFSGLLYFRCMERIFADVI